MLLFDLVNIMLLFKFLRGLEKDESLSIFLLLLLFNISIFEILFKEKDSLFLCKLMIFEFRSLEFSGFFSFSEFIFISNNKSGFL